MNCPTARPNFNRVHVWTEQPLFPLDTWTASVGKAPSLQCHLWCHLPVALFNSSPVKSRRTLCDCGVVERQWETSTEPGASIHVEKRVAWQGTTASSPSPFPVYRQNWEYHERYCKRRCPYSTGDIQKIGFGTLTTWLSKLSLGAAALWVLHLVLGPTI